MRELSSRGVRKECFRADQYRELRRIDSVEVLADFFDRSGCKHVPVSADVVEMANAIIVERSAPDGVRNPMFWSLIFGAWGLLTLPVALLWRAAWRDRDE